MGSSVVGRRWRLHPLCYAGERAPRRGMGRVAPGLWLFGGALGWGHGARVPTPTVQFPVPGPAIPPPAAVR